MKNLLPLRSRIGISIANGLTMASTPAYGDPITVAVFGTAFAATLGGAIVTAVISFAITSIASMVLTKLFAPKQNAQDRQASVLQISIGEGPREALFGEIATGGSFADGFNYGGSDGTDWEALVIPVADHRCHSLTGFYVGDVYVAFAGDGPVAGYGGQLEVYWREGTEDQVMPSIVTTNGGWAASDNLAGIATVIVAYKADKPDSKTPIWTAGRPSFLWVVKGALLYLPRFDSSVGGAGPHRWDDPSTREWSDNPMDCRYNWVRGIYACDRIDEPGMLLIGRGLSAIEAPAEESFSFANTCDEPVALKNGGSEKRYRCNLVVRANDDYISTEETFAACCAGIIIQRQGGVQVEPGSARSVVAEITDDDFVVGETITFNAFKSDTQRINSVVPRYIEPAQRWADHAAPLRRNLADLAIDGGPREEPLSLIAVTSNTQAQRCGEIRRRLTRMERTASFTLGPRFAHLEEGDWIGWTSARHLRGQRVVFRINSYSLAASWRNTIAIEEISAQAFSWNPAVDELTPGAVAVQQTPPTRGAPSASDWTFTGETIASAGGSQPAIVFAGAAGSDYVEQIVFEYRLAGGTDADWIGSELAGPGVRRREIASVSPGTSYHGAISYIIGGVPTERLVLGPVAAGELSVAGVASADDLAAAQALIDAQAATLHSYDERISALE